MRKLVSIAMALVLVLGVCSSALAYNSLELTAQDCVVDAASETPTVLTKYVKEFYFMPAINWVSSDETIAMINPKTGEVIPVADGVITVTAYVASTAWSKSMTVAIVNTGKLPVEPVKSTSLVGNTSNTELRPISFSSFLTLSVGDEDDDGVWTPVDSNVITTSDENKSIGGVFASYQNATMPFVLFSSDESILQVHPTSGKLVGIQAGSVVVTGYLLGTNLWDAIVVEVTGAPRYGYVDQMDLGDATLMTVVCRRLNLRTAPSLSGKIDMVMDRGSYVIASGVVNGWAVIEFNGKTYYAYTNGGNYLADVMTEIVNEVVPG